MCQNLIFPHCESCSSIGLDGFAIRKHEDNARLMDPLRARLREVEMSIAMSLEGRNKWKS